MVVESIKGMLNESVFEIGGYNILVNGFDYVYFDKKWPNNNVTKYAYNIKKNSFVFDSGYDGVPDLRNVTEQELVQKLESAGLDERTALRISYKVGAKKSTNVQPSSQVQPTQKRQMSKEDIIRKVVKLCNQGYYYEISNDEAEIAYNAGAIGENELDKIRSTNRETFTYNWRKYL